MRKILWISLGFAVGIAFNYSQSFADDGGLMKKMSTIEEQQAKILQSLDEIKSELNIVKVRVTNSQ